MPSPTKSLPAPIDPGDSSVPAWAHRLELQLDRLKSHVESESGTVARLMGERQQMEERILTEVREIRTHQQKSLHGNGSPGIYMRLDRLENAEEARRLVVRAVVVAVVGMVAKMLFDTFGTINSRPSVQPVVLQQILPPVPTRAP